MRHDAAGHPANPPYMPTRACLCGHGFSAEFFTTTADELQSELSWYTAIFWP